MIFLERKEPVYIFAWTLLLVFIPLLGFVLYLIFGNGPKFIKRKSFKGKKKWDELYSHYMQENHRQIEIREGKDSNYTSLMKLNLNAGKSLVTTKNEVKIYTNGVDKFQDLFKDIRNAKSTIHVIYYIFRADDIGLEFIRILEEKALEGVEVRVVYDDLGSIHTPSKAFRQLIKNGGEVYKFFPAKYKVLGLNINYRNHRKIVVIDSEIAYTGGMNVGVEYLSKGKKLTPWRDTHIRIVGESVSMLQIRFLQDFMYAAHEALGDETLRERFEQFFPPKDFSHLKEQYIQVVSSGPDTGGQELKNSFIKMLYIAQRTIDIQTPYFIPDTAFFEAIRSAALSNVRIRIMIPKLKDSHFVGRVTDSHFKELIDMGVEVYLYEGFIHAKTLTIDNKMTTIGTANLDIRSFKLNFEVNTFIYDSQIAEEMTQIFEDDLLCTHRVTYEDEKNKKWYVRVEESIYRLLSLVM